MQFGLNETVLTLFFEGEINSMTASKVEVDAEETLKKKEFKTLVLDFDKVTYVSSAGLRIILKLKQKYGDVSIVNASLEVYDVLQMTGFTNVMSVSKALRVIDVSNAELIGEGYFSLVYRLNKDTIVKVFKKADNPDDIQRELNLAKQAFILGIPTAISFDIVKVGDKFGVIFEMLDSVSLRDMFRDEPKRYNELIDKYTALLKKINSTEPIDDKLPDTKKQWLDKLEVVKDYIKPEEYKKALKLLQTIPNKNTFVHGDCHFKNIMVQGNELFLIDMDTLSKGHHIFELAAIFAPYIAFEEDEPGNNERFLGVKSDLVAKIYHDVIVKYFGKDDPAIFDKIKIVSYIHMVWWNRMNEPNNNVRLNGCKDRLVSLLDKYEDLIID